MKLHPLATVLVAGPLFGASLALPAAPAFAACSLSVSAVSPAAGFAAGGTTSTVTGCGFTGGTVSATYDTTAATSVSVASDTSLSVVSPAHAAGSVVLTLRVHPTTGSDTTATASFTYVDPPSLTSLTPPSGPERGATGVTLTGDHFTPPVGSVGVVFGSTAATGVTASSATRLSAVSPAGTGTVNVAVVTTLPGGEKATSSSVAYRYVPAPVVTATSPTSGPPTGGQDVTITGQHFQPGAVVFFGPSDGSAAPLPNASRFPGDSAGSPVSVLSDTSILVTSTTGKPGPTNIVVLNPDGQFGALSSAATAHYSFDAGTPPVITGVAPSAGGSLGGTRVTITGSGFAPSASVTFASSGQSSPPAGTAVAVAADGTSLAVTTPAHAAGAVDITVTNPTDGQRATSASAFTYSAAAAPTLSSAGPTSATSLGGTSLTLTGTGFAPGASVTVGGTPAPRSATLSSTTMSVVSPARPAGATTITVTNPDGQSSAGLTFTVVAAAAPAITGITPGSGPSGTDVRITGTGFATTTAAASADAVISVGTAACVPGSATSTAGCLQPLPPVAPALTSPPLVRSATAIEGLIPAGPGGVLTITVTNPDGQTATTSFTDTSPTGAPSLTSASPSTGSTLGGTVVTLTGSNLLPGAVVGFGSGARSFGASAVVAADGTSVTAIAPAGVYGLVDLTVTNPGGQSAALPLAFTFTTAPAPTITSVSPTTGIAGTLVTITGSGFAVAGSGALASSTVTVGGQMLLPAPPVAPATTTLPVVRSNTSIVGVVPSGTALGAVDIAVVNPDGQGAISQAGYTYPADTTPPVTSIGAVAGGLPYSFGSWSHSPVTVTLSATDAGSGVRAITYSATGAQPAAITTVPATVPRPSFVISRDGTTVVTYAATDQAGNSETARTATVKVDSSAPVLSVSASVPANGVPVPYTSGSATNQNVTVTLGCADAATGSGVASLTYDAGSATTTVSGTNPLQVVVTSSGSGQSVTGTCTDAAGNRTTSVFSGIDIVKTAPTIAAAATAAGGLPYTAGTWTNRTVTVTFTCTPLSADDQVATLTAPVQVVGPVANGTVSGTCIDAAGNSSTVTFGTAALGIDIDLTLPVATASARTTDSAGHTVAYTAGTWTGHDVIVTFACTDPGAVSSGVASIDAPVTVTAAGTTSGVVGGCQDQAGNTANPPAFFGPILIDRTPPTCTVYVGPGTLSPSNGKLINVSTTVPVVDAASGAGGFVLLSVVSNNPATAASDIAGFLPGTASTTGQLRATKGRRYTFSYRAFDVAGNTALCSATVAAG